jgi:hypothetical protein
MKGKSGGVSDSYLIKRIFALDVNVIAAYLQAIAVAQMNLCRMFLNKIAIG